MLIANSANEKEQWRDAIMNSILPRFPSQGLRRSLSLFSIGELDQEDDDDEWACVTTPKKIMQRLLSQRSQSKSKVPPSPNGGDGANATRARFNVPSLDADYPFDSGEFNSDSPMVFDLPHSSDSSNTKVINPLSSIESSNAKNGDDASPRATPNLLTTLRESLSDNRLFDVENDSIPQSPEALPSLRQHMLPSTITQGTRDLLDVVVKHAKDAAPIDVDEVTEIWQQEGFVVAAKRKRGPVGGAERFIPMLLANGIEESCDVYRS
jgi:hypothetical protein